MNSLLSRNGYRLHLGSIPDIEMKIPVNSIVIPDRFIPFMGHMFYAISPSGNLILGIYRPWGCNTKEKWYLTLWRELTNDIGYIRLSVGVDHEDYAELSEFENWADEVADRLCKSYGLEEWDSSMRVVVPSE